MERIIIIIAFFLIYFHISGLATTNILRLTRGNVSTVLASNVYVIVAARKYPPFISFRLFHIFYAAVNAGNAKQSFQ